MDIIVIGLDFGTHQTKMCIQRTPDEGHGQPSYEFFKFQDLDGNDNYFLPSIVQVNNDGTLSYGFVDSDKAKSHPVKPQLEEEPEFNDYDVDKEARLLCGRYSKDDKSIAAFDSIRKMLSRRKEILQHIHSEEADRIRKSNEDKLAQYYGEVSTYRYFKQATFTEREWFGNIDSDTVCVWYLAFVLFCLEKEFGTDFAINMGVPADSNSFEKKKQQAATLLLTAYYLVEDVYHNDMEAFLSEKVDILKEKTKFRICNELLKKEYNIKVFPEAYASMISLTSRGRLTPGMCLAVDIGGGTTDISFFTIMGKEPLIYRFWSLDKGLNFIVEESGYDYQDGAFEKLAQKKVIHGFNMMRTELYRSLEGELYQKLSRETSIDKGNLTAALANRILVYNGGGSTFRSLTVETGTFTDVVLVNEDMWKTENVKEKDIVAPISPLLNTSYGLSVGKNDDRIPLCEFSELFGNLRSEGKADKDYVDKDMC